MNPMVYLKLGWETSDTNLQWNEVPLPQGVDLDHAVIIQPSGPHHPKEMSLCSVMTEPHPDLCNAVIY